MISDMIYDMAVGGFRGSRVSAPLPPLSQYIHFLITQHLCFDNTL